MDSQVIYISRNYPRNCTESYKVLKTGNQSKRQTTGIRMKDKVCRFSEKKGRQKSSGRNQKESKKIKTGRNLSIPAGSDCVYVL